MLKSAARTLLLVAFLIASGCGYEAGATFNGDGSVVVSLKFLVPKALTQSGSGTSVSGISPADIQKANRELAAKYPGAKVFTITEGDETGAEETIPFKTEKEAFAFLTQPSKLAKGLSGAASTSLDLGNTGGLFASATHTFQPGASTPGNSGSRPFRLLPLNLGPRVNVRYFMSGDQVMWYVSIGLLLSTTVPHEITSADGALFTADRKTAIWKLSLVHAQTFVATTGPGGIGLAANTITGISTAVLVGVVLVAVGLGFLGGLVIGWSRMHLHAAAPAAHAAFVTPAPVDAGSGGVTGPPPDVPPPPSPAA